MRSLGAGAWDTLLAKPKKAGEQRGSFMAGKATILCIDDRLDGLKVRTMLLEQMGYDTIAVPDYQSAMRTISENEVDLLVIDYHLGGDETGEDVARDVRAMRPAVPLIMLTGDPKIPESACNSVDVVLIKGTSGPRILLNAIEKLLQDAALREQTLP